MYVRFPVYTQEDSDFESVEQTGGYEVLSPEQERIHKGNRPSVILKVGVRSLFHNN